MNDAGEATNDVASATQQLEKINLSDPQPSTSSSDGAIRPSDTTIHIKGKSSKFDDLVKKFLNGCQQRRENDNVWIIRLTRSRNGESEYVFAAGESDEKGHVEDYFMAWCEQNASDYDFTWLKVYANSTPCSECARRLVKWLDTKRTTYLSIHFAFMLEFWGKAVRTREMDYPSINCKFLALNRIDKVKIADLVKDLNIESQERIEEVKRIIYEPKILLDGEPGFKDLVDKFFAACKIQNTRATYWIFKLEQSSTSKSTGVFAAGENEGYRNDHAEVVFMKWWNSYGNSTYKSLTVFTNYAPCTDCATELHKWLDNNPSAPNLYIRYAFVYVEYKNDPPNRKKYAKNYSKNLIKMIDSKKLHTLEKIDTGSLTQLAKNVGFEKADYEYKIPDYASYWDHKHIERRIIKALERRSRNKDPQSAPTSV